MEYRKIISFGKSSFVISLPKNWIRRNNLGKGDLVYLNEVKEGIVVQPEQNSDDSKFKEIVINVDGKTEEGLSREVCTAYILNHRKVIFKGNELKSKVKSIQTVIQSLIALEIMEQTPDSIVAQDFLNMDTISIQDLIKKMDIVTRTMIKETKLNFDEDHISTLDDRDKDVNRLYFLVYRSVLYNLQNPMKALKNFNMTSLDLVRSKSLSFYIEAIADESRRTARYIKKIKLSKDKIKEHKIFLEKIEEYYVDTIKTAYNKDIQGALKLSDTKERLEKHLLKFESDVMKVEYMNRYLCRLERWLSLIHNLGRVIYTLE